MTVLKPQASSPNGSQPARKPTIGLALGGGGARGLAHIAMIEAFDELGIKPDVIAGTSIGAVYGAAYASGMSGRDLRDHTRFILSQRFGLIRDLFTKTAQPFQRLLSVFGARNAILDPFTVLDLILPKEVKETFADCKIPLKVVASDFYDQEPKVFTEGPLRTAIAASMALPVLFQPVVLEGRALIDGGLTNPLPFDLLLPETDIVVAIDVSGSPVADAKRVAPTAFAALFSSAFLFEHTIVKEKLRAKQPDIFIRAGTSNFQVLDFLKCDDILAAAQPAKERLKQQLQRVLSVETLPVLEDAEPIQKLIAAPKRPKRRLLTRPRKTRE
ncbi:patatin-like phospholipase family protein [Hyphomicrobium sp.]|uniref:patatin-like phospholipase family protein n=1 Tax=Hyphomicrobium sp. TaxID=82 RepID=UPI000F98CC1A|nr:patatin-like phospholipase family protein [Hyphomicrobium sp.]RUP08155.1 MAG: patatin-like phospholipase family protein [Hyphomicrobium sp.]